MGVKEHRASLGTHQRYGRAVRRGGHGKSDLQGVGKAGAGLAQLHMRPLMPHQAGDFCRATRQQGGRRAGVADEVAQRIRRQARTPLRLLHGLGGQFRVARSGARGFNGFRKIPAQMAGIHPQTRA